MTTGIDGTATERVSVPAVLADLIMLGQLHKLPDPIAMRATDSNAIVGLDFASRAALDAWAEALGISDSTATQPHEGGALHNAYLHRSQRGGLGGYSVNLTAHTPAEVHTELPAATLIALDHIANPPAVEPCEGCGWDNPVTRGCPCGRLYCGHCECDCADWHLVVHEGHEGDYATCPMPDCVRLRGEIASPPAVSDERAEEILAGLNGFIVPGDDFHLDAATSWAATQKEVAEAELVCDGPPEIKLADGTLIVWEPSFKRWCIVAGSAS